MAFFITSTPALYVKSFDDILLCHAEFSSLQEMNIPYSLFFNGKDEIDILYIAEGEPKVLSSDIDRIPIDAKRWELLAKQVKDTANAPAPVVEEKERKRLVLEGTTEKKKTIPEKEIPARHSHDRDPLLSGDEPELSRQLENLKLQFVIGQLSEDSYQSEKAKIERALRHLRGADALDMALPGLEAPVAAAPPPGGEKEKVEKLLEKLEERFVFGEISEESYKELKEKYSARLKSLSC